MILLRSSFRSEPVWKFALPIGLPFMYNTNMNKSINVKQKKRGRPATGKTPITGVRLDDDTTSAIESFRASKVPEITQSEAIRRILRDWLVGHGYLKD